MKIMLIVLLVLLIARRCMRNYYQNSDELQTAIFLTETHVYNVVYKLLGICVGGLTLASGILIILEVVK